MKHSAASYLLFLLLWMMSSYCAVGRDQTLTETEDHQTDIALDKKGDFYTSLRNSISRSKRQLDEEDVLNNFELERIFPLYELSVNVPNSPPVLQKKKVITPTDRLLLLKLSNPILKNQRDPDNDRRIYYDEIDESPFAYKLEGTTEKPTSNPFIFDNEHVISESGKQNMRKEAWNPLTNKRYYYDEVEREKFAGNVKKLQQDHQQTAVQRQGDHEHVINYLTGTKKLRGPPAGDITDPAYQPIYQGNESSPRDESVTTTMMTPVDPMSQQLSSPLLASATQMPKVITRHILLQSGRVVQINVTLPPPDAKPNEGWKPIRNGRQPSSRPSTTTPMPKPKTIPHSSRQPKLIARYVLLKSGRLVQINVTSTPSTANNFRERETQPTVAYTPISRVIPTTASPKFEAAKPKAPKSNIITRYLLLKSGKIVQINVTSSNNTTGTYNNPFHTSSVGVEEYFGYRTRTRTRKYPDADSYPNPNNITNPRSDFEPETTTYPTRRTTTSFRSPKVLENAPPKFKPRAENEGIPPTTTTKTTVIGPFQIEEPYFRIIFEPVKLKNNKIGVSFTNHNCTPFRTTKDHSNPNIPFREREQPSNTQPNRNSYYNLHIHERNTFVSSTPKSVMAFQQGSRYENPHNQQWRQNKDKPLNETRPPLNPNKHQQATFRETVTKRTANAYDRTTNGVYPTMFTEANKQKPDLEMERIVTTPKVMAFILNTELKVQNRTAQNFRNEKIRRNDNFAPKTTDLHLGTERVTLPSWIKNFTPKQTISAITTRSNVIKPSNTQNRTWGNLPLAMKQPPVQKCGNNCSIQQQGAPAASFYFDSTRRRNPVGYSLPEHPQTRILGMDRESGTVSRKPWPELADSSVTESWQSLTSKKPKTLPPPPTVKTPSAVSQSNNTLPNKWQNAKLRNRNAAIHLGEREKKASTISRRIDNFNIQVTTVPAFTLSSNNRFNLPLQTKVNNRITKKPAVLQHGNVITTKRSGSSTPSSRLVVDSNSTKKPFRVYFFEPRRTRGRGHQNQAEVTTRRNTREREFLEPRVIKPGQSPLPSPKVPEKTVAFNQRLVNTKPQTTRIPRKSADPVTLAGKSPVNNKQKFPFPVGLETSTRKTTRLNKQTQAISLAESTKQRNGNNNKWRTISVHNGSTLSMSIPTSTSAPQKLLVNHRKPLPAVRGNPHIKPSSKVQLASGKSTSTPTTVVPSSEAFQGPVNKQIMESLQMNPHMFEPLRLRRGK